MGGKRKEKKEKGKGKKERGLTGFLREGGSRILRGRGRSQIKEGRKREIKEKKMQINSKGKFHVRGSKISL